MSNLSDWGHLVADAVERMVKDRRCNPVATYRLQFAPKQLTFRDAAAIVPYLDGLGISHLYASPYLKTRSGSSHGYAIVDYGQLNPELGGEDDYSALVDALHSYKMGHILDIVSNHMSAAPAENLWWNNVLENGPGSPYASYFDIDWHPIKEQLQNKILLPMLGDQYGKVLESGELKLEYQEGAFFIRYYHMLLPLDPRTYRTILNYGLDDLKKNLPADFEDLLELESIATALEHLPERTETIPDRVTERQREKEVIKKRLRNLVERSVEIAAFIGQNLRHLNGTPENQSTYDDLDKLLDMQVYRLSHWKAAADEVNYRRFFDINELAAVCMEDPKVFQESHKLVFDLLVRGDVDALRIDHIDGLYDPMEYLRRLQWGYLRRLGYSAYRQLTETPGTRPENSVSADNTEPPQWNEVEPAFLQIILGRIDSDPPPSVNPSPPSNNGTMAYIPDRTDTNGVLRASLPLYVAVEKILGPEEPLPEQWLVAGTTGYDFLNFVNGLFVNWSGLQQLVKSYGRYIDEPLIFRETAQQSKLLILRTAMSSELQLLAYRLNRISERHRSSRDFTLNTLRIAHAK